MPLVPVMPYTFSFFEGSPNTAQARPANAARASGTTTEGPAGISFSATTSAAPLRKASSANSVPSRWKPGTATKAEPGFTARESCVTPAISTPDGTPKPKIFSKFAESRIIGPSLARPHSALTTLQLHGNSPEISSKHVQLYTNPATGRKIVKKNTQIVCYLR